MVNYILRTLIALDQLINVVICNGEPDETMSSVAWRMEQQGRFWGFMRPLIDWLFSYWGTDHCRNAFEAERHRIQLPTEFNERTTL